MSFLFFYLLKVLPLTYVIPFAHKKAVNCRAAEEESQETVILAKPNKALAEVTGYLMHFEL